MKKLLLALSIIFILILSLVSCTDGEDACSHANPDVRIENEIKATCLTDGSCDKVTYCTDCDKVLSTKRLTSPSQGYHTPADPVEENRVDATCIADGSYESVIYCTECDGEISRETVRLFANGEHIPAEPTEENRVEATCGKDGSYDIVEYCDECGDEISRETVHLSATGEHTADDPKIENRIEPDCKTDGSYDRVIYCVECGDMLVREEHSIPTEGHAWQTVKGTPATETKDGLTDGEACSVCGEVKTPQSVIPAAIQGTDIKTNALVKDGTALTLTVPTASSTFNFATDILVNSKSSFTVSERSDGTSEIASKTVALAEGENVFYITVTDKDGEKKVYTATITREKASGIEYAGITIPSYSGAPWVEVNGNVPTFTPSEITSESFYRYTDLDSLGRAGVAFGSLSKDLMPTDDRESISHIFPSGWKYNGVNNNKSYTSINGQTVYNRTHLFAHMLVSDDVDVRNFVTGTYDMNQRHMTKYENMVCDYIKETGNHVMYRVTPIFEGENLICTGLLLEAYSVEDGGEGVSFCVFLYNVQPGIEINYLTGENRSENEEVGGDTPSPDDSVNGKFDTDKTYYLVGVFSSGTRYWNGTNSQGMQTTTDKASAVKVCFESAGSENAYYIYIIQSGKKLYLSMGGNKTTSMALTETKSTYWIYNEETGNLTSSYESGNSLGNRCLSTDPTRTDIRAYYEGESGEEKKYNSILVVEAN